MVPARIIDWTRPPAATRLAGTPMAELPDQDLAVMLTSPLAGVIRCDGCGRWPAFVLVVGDADGAVALCHCLCRPEPTEVDLAAAELSALRMAPPPATLIDFCD
jgi:hypothetical protein